MFCIAKIYFLSKFREFELLVLITAQTINMNARQPRPDGNRQNPVNKCLDLVFGKQVSDFLGGKQVSGNRCLFFLEGNRCRETGVWIWLQETGVGKQVS